MAFETFAVSTVYRFSGNHLAILGEIADSATKTAAALDSLQVSVDRTVTALATFSKAAPEAREQMRGLTRNVESLAAASAKLDGVATSFGTMASASKTAAVEVDASTVAMSDRLKMLRADAAQTAASFKTLGRAGASAGTTAGAGAYAGGSHGAADAASGSRFGGILGGIGTGASLASLGILAEGLHGAASLQDARVQTGIALGPQSALTDSANMKLAMQMSMATAQSVTDSMGLLRVMATSGLNDPKTMAALAMPIAKFADTQYLGTHHVAFDESAAQMAALSHQLGLRTAEQMKPFLNTAFKISQDMPDSLGKAITQVKYYGGSYTNAGVAPSETLALQATADRLGFGTGKSGTGFNMILRNLQHASGDKMLAAQMALGLTARNGQSNYIDRASGRFDPEKLFSDLNVKYNAARRDGKVSDFNATLQQAFTSNAGLIASVMSSNAGRDQRKAVNTTLARVEDLEVSQARLMETLNARTKLLSSNFATLTTIIAGPLIAPLTAFVTKLGDVIGSLGMFLAANKSVTTALSAIVASGAVIGVVKLFQMLGGFGVFVHAAAHHAQHSVGVGAGARIAAHEGEHVAASVAGNAVRARRGLGIGEIALDALTLAPMLRGLRGARGTASTILQGGAKGIRGRAGDAALEHLVRPVVALDGAFAEAATRMQVFRSALERGFAPIVRLVPGLARFGGAGRFAGTAVALLMRSLPFLAGGFLRLGLRAVPLVGNILLVIDVLKALGSHSFDIGHAIGVAARWIHDNGIPMIVGAFRDLIGGIFDFVKSSIGGIFNGGHGGIFDVVGNLVRGVKAGYGSPDDVTGGKGQYLTTNARDRLGSSLYDSPKSQRGAMVINGPMHFHGVQNPADFHRAMNDYRGTNASQGGAPVSWLTPSASTTGIGTGR